MRDQKVVSFSFPFRAGLPIAGGLLIAVVIFPAWLGYSLGLERGWSKPAPRVTVLVMPSPTPQVTVIPRSSK